MLNLFCLLLALNLPGVVENNIFRLEPGRDGPPIPQSIAVLDTLNLYGGPGLLEGKFQTADGLPDPQGWTTRDDTAPPNTVWNISSFNAANLDPDKPGNLAWWCGTVFHSCQEGDPAEGYGNSWNSALGWSTTVADPSLTATVSLTGILNSDTEPGYDSVELSYITPSGPMLLLGLDSSHTGLELNEAFTFQPGDYTGPNADQMVLEIRFISDGAWSDEDCLYPTTGACQVDNLQVTIQQPSAEPIVGPVETCEAGDPSTWAPLPTQGVGNFAQLWTGLDDLDQDQDNPSPQWAFLDDGVIVPGTGGSYCEYGFWCYGPDSLVVNIHGGLTGEYYRLENSVISPAVALPADPEFSQLVVGLDAYLHNGTSEFDPTFLTWYLEWTDDPAGQSGWQTLPSQNYFAYWADEGHYTRLNSAVPTDELEPGALFTRLIVAIDTVPIWDWGFHAPTPAPYFDNVRLQAVIGDPASPVPALPEYLAISCRPNPFNPSVEINWSLPQADKVTVQIYDLRGKLVRTVCQGPGPAEGSVVWQGDDDLGQNVATGAYLCRVTGGGQSAVRKITLLK